MSPSRHSPGESGPGAQVKMRAAALTLWLAALPFFSGCAFLPPQLTDRVVPEYRPHNIYIWGSTLPPQIRRVALLPVSCDEQTSDALEERNVLEPVLQAEFTKLHKFEVTSISARLLRDKTGQDHWDCEEALPADFFAWLSQNRGCDAVVFCKLTTFRANAPLAIGWRMRLVDVRTRSTVWAGDEVFDAGLPEVRAGMRHYQAVALRSGSIAGDDWLIENSPRQFGQYAAAQLLATIPGL